MISFKSPPRSIVLGLFLTIISIFVFYLLKKPAGACPKCNVILISLDTLRADSLECYGYFRNTAPNLCEFAKNNIIFKNSYSNAESTLPSHASIFTSLYPSSHGLTQVARFELNPRIITLAQFLKNNGYKTITVAPPEDLNLPQENKPNNLGKGVDKFIINSADSEAWADGLDSLLKNSQGEKPTFLFLHTYGIHSPYINTLKEHVFAKDSFPKIPSTPSAYEFFDKTLLTYILKDLEVRIEESETPESLAKNTELYKKLKEAGSLEQARLLFEELPSYQKDGIYTERYFNSIDPQDPKQVAHLKALYDEGIYLVDQTIISHTLNFLKSNNLDKKTIVVITSDHGEEFQEHGNFLHGPPLYNHVTFVPLIISVPGVAKREIKAPVQGIDIYPSIAGLLGLKAPEWLQGTDLTGLILGYPFAKKNKYIVSESYGLLHRSIRGGKWELEENNITGKVELYDIKNDFYEKENLADNYPSVVKKLTKAMNNILEKRPDFPHIDVGWPNWLDEIKRKQLEREGYF